MDHGIKTSKENFDVLTGQKSNKSPNGARRISHVVSILAVPYLLGSRKQLNRYNAAASKLPTNPPLYVLICMHEASCLFEDLATISWYANKIGSSHKLDGLWHDIRDHIRHDIREGFDSRGDYYERRRSQRTKRLGIPESMQTNVGFEKTRIKVGNKVVAIKDIEEYINWADQLFGAEIKEAMGKGLITN